LGRTASQKRLNAVFVVAVALSAGCGPGETAQTLEQGEGPGEGFLVLQGNHDVYPPGVGSFLITMKRQGPSFGCGSSITSFSRCSTGTDEIVTVCSGTWQMVPPLATGAYASNDCSGVRVNATVSMSPSPVVVPYGETARAVLDFQGSSVLLSDVTFNGSQLVDPSTFSVSARARRTPNPDPGCGTAVSDIADQCFSFTPGTNFPPQALSNSACSGDWVICAVGWSNSNCTGSQVSQGVATANGLNFGNTDATSVDLQPAGPACPF
jgi:hypothetical protein